ncbi:MAG: hypothetical protein JSR99_08225 [Proteobacteria bacterium]|nr:hypothetical protein [Pseudomonadota bacterium]
MHYRLRPGIVVKSENAAKPVSQGSMYLRILLAQLPQVESAFDFGCGKLRYVPDFLEKSDSLALVDSEVQLSRTQILLGIKTTVHELARKSNRLMAMSECEFVKLRREFDRGYCINMLSVVPFFRKRRDILQTIRLHLKPGAHCLFVVQYRNSDFTRMRRMRNAKPWRDGFLINSLRGYSFYGLIAPPKLVKMVEKAGFEVQELKLYDGSAYLWASRQ